MDNTVGMPDGGPLPDQHQWVGLGSHAKLERQGSKGNKGCPTPSRQVSTPLGNRVDSEKQSDDLHMLLSIVSRGANTQTHPTSASTARKLWFSCLVFLGENALQLCSIPPGLWVPIMGRGAKMEGRDRGDPSHPLRREESEAGQRRLQELLQETVQKEVKTERRCTSLTHQKRSRAACELMSWASFCSHRGGDEKKDKGGEKTAENQNSSEHDAVKPSKHLEINHGTAV